MNNKIKATEVCEILGVTRITLSNWRKKQINLPFYKVGSRYFYDIDDINAFKSGKKTEKLEDESVTL